MKKYFLVSLVFVLIVASNAFGASARWQALGNEHRFIIDTSNYGIYPGRIHQFANAMFVIPTLDQGNNTVAAGFLKKVNDNMSLAFHMNVPSAGLGKLNAALKGFDKKNDRLVGMDLRTFPDLFWAMKTGNMTVGARVRLAMDKASTTAPKEVTTSAMAADVDAGVTMAMPFGELDLGIGAGIQSFSDDDGSKITESTGGYAVSVNARLNKPMGKQTMLVPILSATIGAEPTEKDVSETSYISGDVGVGYRLTFENKKMVVAGLVVGLNSTTKTPAGGEETKITVLTPKFVAGCETPLTKWLIVRGGANAALEKRSNDVGSMDVNYYYNMGFRIVYSGFILDAIVCRDIFHRGPQFIGGSTGENKNLATNVCLTYAF